MPRRRDIGRLPGEIEELFADLWQVPRFSGMRRGFRPQADVYRQADPPALVVVVELCGIDPADVHIEATATTLLIRGHRERPPAPGAIAQMEIEYGPFERRIPLGVEVDTERASATYERGLLTIVLPIAERPPQPVKAPVEVRTRD